MWGSREPHWCLNSATFWSKLWSASPCSENTVGTLVNLNRTLTKCLSSKQNKDRCPHFTGFLYILARKYLSAESFLLAFGFKVRTLPNTLRSLSWSLWARIPSQYLQSREPPGCRIFSAKSVRDKHIMVSLSWSISRKPLAFGAMSLRMTWARPLGSSSCSLLCVEGSVTSWLDRKWAPSREGMLRRSIPITVPQGNSGSRMKSNIVFYIDYVLHTTGWATSVVTGTGNKLKTLKSTSETPFFHFLHLNVQSLSVYICCRFPKTSNSNLIIKRFYWHNFKETRWLIIEKEFSVVLNNFNSTNSHPGMAICTV